MDLGRSVGIRNIMEPMRSSPHRATPHWGVAFRWFESLHLCKKERPSQWDGLSFLVGVSGFEPEASWTRTKRDTKLRHTPIAKIL